MGIDAEAWGLMGSDGEEVWIDGEKVGINGEEKGLMGIDWEE